MSADEQLGKALGRVVIGLLLIGGGAVGIIGLIIWAVAALT